MSAIEHNSFTHSEVARKAHADHESIQSPPIVDDETQDTRYDWGPVVNGDGTIHSIESQDSSTHGHNGESGRTYHQFKEGKYLLPNDKPEQKRLNMQHELFKFTFHGKLNLAPIGPSPRNVMDFACGTGIWAIDFAQQYPSAQVVGFDLSAIQPSTIPPNCHFEIGDAEEEWTFNQKFDYIHGRALATCFKNPSYILGQAFNCLAPGGYLELQDGTFPMSYIGEPPVDSHVYKWNEIVIAGSQKNGRPWTNTRHYKRWMEEIGFEDVVVRDYYWPLNPWAKGEYFKEIGARFGEDLLIGLEGLSLKVMGLMGWNVEDIQAFLEGLRKDIQDPKIHAYMPMIVVYGRKPGHGSLSS